MARILFVGAAEPLLRTEKEPTRAHTPEYKAKRALYVEKYGADRVRRALDKAGRHRVRPRTTMESGDFTGWELLDLLNSQNFACLICNNGFVDLEPHHCLELMGGGTNKIDNIVCLCKPCHNRVHDNNLRMEKGWFDRQQTLCNNVKVGDWVEYQDPVWVFGPPLTRRYIPGLHPPPSFPVGEVVEIFSPKESVKLSDDFWKNSWKEGGILWTGSNGNPFKHFSHWSSAHVSVRFKANQVYFWSSWEQVRTVFLEHTTPLDMEDWFAEQEYLYGKFYEGDMVPFGERALPGIIVWVNPPERPTSATGNRWVRASADIYRPSGGHGSDNVKPAITRTLLENLKCSSADKWLEHQRALVNMYAVGEEVRRKGAPNVKTGIVLSLAPPEIGPSWREINGEQPFSLPTDWVPWKEGVAEVHWTHNGKTSTSNVDISAIKKMRAKRYTKSALAEKAQAAIAAATKTAPQDRVQSEVDDLSDPYYDPFA